MQRKLCMLVVVSLNGCIANAQSKPDSQASAAALLKAGRVLDGVSTQVGLSIRFSGPINFGDYPVYQALDKDLSEKLCSFFLKSLRFFSLLGGHSRTTEVYDAWCDRLTESFTVLYR